MVKVRRIGVAWASTAALGNRPCRRRVICKTSKRAQPLSFCLLPSPITNRDWPRRQIKTLAEATIIEDCLMRLWPIMTTKIAALASAGSVALGLGASAESHRHRPQLTSVVAGGVEVAANTRQRGSCNPGGFAASSLGETLCGVPCLRLQP